MSFGPTVMDAEGMADYIGDLKIDYIGGYNITGDAYCPPHGSTECIVDKFNLCAQAATNDTQAFWDYTYCLYENQDNLKCSGDEYCCEFVPCKSFNTAMAKYNDQCAIKAGLIPELLTQCAFSDQGDSLQQASYAKTSAAGIQHPSWIWINGQLYDQPVGKTNTDEWAKNVLKEMCELINNAADGCGSN